MAEEIKYNIAVTGTGQAVAGINAVTVAQQRLTKTAANSGVALQNLNFVIRDSPYFFKDFSLGVLAVGNNMNPLIDSMIRMKKEATDMGMTFRGALMNAIKGPAGVVLGFSLLVTVLQAVTFAMSGTKKEAKETKDELSKLRGELDKLTESQLKNQIAVTEVALGKALPKGARVLTGAGGRTSLMGASGSMITEGEAFELNQRLNMLRQAYYTLGDIENIENRLRINRERLKNLNEINLALYKDVGSTYAEIKAKLEQWIATDEKSLKVNRTKAKEHKDYLDMVAEGYKFISEEEEKLFKRRIDLMDKIRERAIRSGMSPDQAEAFGMGMSMQLQGESPEMWGGGMRKVPEHPLKKFWDESNVKTTQSITLIQALAREAQSMGDVLADAFMKGAKAADVFNAIAGKVLGALISFIIGGALGASGIADAAQPAIAGSMNKPSSGGGIDVNLTGELSAKQDKFIIEFDKSRTKVYNSRRLDLVS